MGTASKDHNLLVQECSSKGIRITRQRRVLLEIIGSANEHLDAVALLRLARERDAGIDRATVYRTLELLKKLRFPDKSGKLKPNDKDVFAGRDTDRARLMCVHCGKMEELEGTLFQRIKQDVERERGFRINLLVLNAQGRCRGCA